jgi:hypothetical protein
MAYSGEGNLIEAVILGDPTKTVIPVVCDSQGRLIIDLTGSSFTIGDVIITDDSGNNAKVDAEGDVQVDVNNFPSLSTFDRLVNERYNDNEEVRMDKPQTFNGTFEYVAFAIAGSPTSSLVWQCLRVEWDLNRRTRMQFRPNISWDNRTIGW